MWHARAALDSVARRNPGAPIAVIGHSMAGGSPPSSALTVACSASSDSHRGGSSPTGARSTAAPKVLALHGSADTVTYARRTAKGIAELRERGVDATYVEVPGGGHAMLDHIATWQGSALGFVDDLLRDVR